MDNFGEMIKKLRKDKKLSLLAASTNLEINQTKLSKIEKGQKKATLELVVKIANFFEVEERELISLWLNNKVLEETSSMEIVAEEREIYNVLSKETFISIIKKIKSILKEDGRVVNAWLYGSMSTLKANEKSDVDLIIEFNELKKYSMFDLLDLAFLIEKKINYKVDIVEKGELKDFALKTAQNNLQKIYG